MILFDKMGWRSFLSSKILLAEKSGRRNSGRKTGWKSGRIKEEGRKIRQRAGGRGGLYICFVTFSKKILLDF